MLEKSLVKKDSLIPKIRGFIILRNMIMNKNGKVVAELGVDKKGESFLEIDEEGFHNGIAVAIKSDGKKEKAGIIDKNGNWLVEPIYKAGLPDIQRIGTFDFFFSVV